MKNIIYDSSFYSTFASTSIASAREVLPIVKELVNPQSVVDVGCGIGTWLRVWVDLGVQNIVGIDGSYVNRDEMMIPADRFVPMDLRTPTKIETRYDLVQSLEVGEHLPERSAEPFISFLCSLAPVVLFSAAIPYQGGMSHLNEQWPEYWARLFIRHGYVPVDAIRDQIWDNLAVAYYYAQNMLIFTKSDNVELPPKLSLLLSAGQQKPLSRVHPRGWQRRNEKPLPLENLIKMLPGSSREFASRSLRKIGVRH